MKTPRRQFLQSSAALAAGMVLPGGSKAFGLAQSASRASLPKIKLGKYEVSRLIIGANPFYGYSHFNRLLDQHMLEWCTSDNVVKTLKNCEQNGINTWQFSHNPRSMADIKRHRAEGGELQWILLSSRAMEEDLSLIDEIAKLKPIGIVHHGGTTDRRWRDGEQAKIKEFLKRVRGTGVMVGMSTHNPLVVEAVEEQGWDVDFFMTCVYNVSRSREELKKILGVTPPYGEVFLPEDPGRMYEAVRKTKKTCLAFKIFAAGRVTDSPATMDQAMKFAYSSIKPGDAAIVGMYPKFSDQVKDNAERARRILKA
jgi:hypothetical protein